MKSNTQKYRGYEIFKIANKRATNVGDAYVVFDKTGSRVESHGSLRDAKAQIDRLIDPVDASLYGCPI